MTVKLTTASQITSPRPNVWLGCALLLLFASLLSGCAANTPKFSLGGTLYGLPSGTTVTLELNSADPITVNTNGAFTFTQPVEKGKPYSVTISAQPTGGYCALNNASGTMGAADVANTVVTCDWTWQGGTDSTAGSTFPAAPGGTGTPGSRVSGATWTDKSGNLWLMGGYGVYSGGGISTLSDMWEYNIKNATWTYVGGSQSAAVTGVYPANLGGTGTPGARYEASTVTDSSGNLWLYGGYGYDSVGTRGALNDLWEYNIANNTWTWVAGSNLAKQAGNYPANPNGTGTPGAHYLSAIWFDAAGNLWLFGGSGYDANGNYGVMNDLWQYSIGSGTWTWLGGSPFGYTAGTYPANTGGTGWPGAHSSFAYSIDATGNLWIFGGYAADGAGTMGYLNDVWEFDFSAKTWTWVSGSNAPNVAATYPASYGGTGQIGSLLSPSGWFDSSGRFWVFGGYQLGAGIQLNNALWYYDTKASTWTWVNGSSTTNPVVTYPGTVGDSGTPPARYSTQNWHDADGNFWIYGGSVENGSSSNYAHDFWEWQN